MTAENETLQQFLTRLAGYRGQEVNGNRLAADAAAHLARLPGMSAAIPQGWEQVGWYRAYDTWHFGELKPRSTRHEFHAGIDRPHDPEDDGNDDWEPAYLLSAPERPE